MRFISIASPKPVHKERDWSKIEKKTVPDQSLSLQDILDRFTRKEALPIGKQTSYNDEIELDSPFAIDLEKLAQADLLDRREALDSWNEVVDKFKAQETERQKAKDAAKAKAKAEADEARIQKEVSDRVAKQTSERSAV